MLRKVASSADPTLRRVTPEGLRERYARLDEIFAEVRREGRLRHTHELAAADSGIGWNGIEVHIGADGEPILGDAGLHRFAMAKVLGLERVPALLGFVHEDAVQKVARFRS